MSAILSNSETLKKTLDDAMNSSGSAMEEHGKQMESITSHINQLKVAWEQLAFNTISSDFMIKIVDTLTSIVNLTDKFGLLNMAIVGIITTFGYFNAHNKAVVAEMTRLGLQTQLTANQIVMANSKAKIFSATLKGMLPVLAITAGIFAIQGLFKVFDSLHTSLEEQTEIVETLNGEYETLKSTVEQLESIETKTDADEEKLKLAKEQLKVKEELLRVAKEEEARKAMSNGFIRTSLDFQAKDETNQLSPKIDNLNGLTDKFKKYSDDAFELQQKIESLKETISADPDGTKSEQLWLKTLERQFVSVNKSADKTKEEIKKAKDEMVADVGGLLEIKEKLMSIQPSLSGEDLQDNKDAVELINKVLLEQGESAKKAEEAIADVKKETDKLTDSNNNLSDSYDDVSDSMGETAVTAEDINNALSNLEKGFKTLDSAQKEYQETGELSLSTLQDIIAQYPLMEDAIADYHMGLITEQELLNDLSRLYDNDMESYRALIESKMGDSKEYYNKLISESSDLFSKLKDDYDIDLDNYSTLNELKSAISDKAYANFIASNAEMVARFKNDYNIDLAHFANATSAKMKMLEKLAEANAKFFESVSAEMNSLNTKNMSSEELAQMETTYAKMNSSATSNIRKGLGEITKLEREIQGLANISTIKMPNFKTPSGKSSGSKGGSGSSKKDDKKEEKYKKWQDLGYDDWIKDIQSSEDKVIEQIEETQANIDKAIILGGQEEELSLQSKLADYYIEQAKINADMAHKFNNEAKWITSVLEKKAFKSLEGIDILNITEKQFDDVIRKLEQKIDNAYGNEKLIAELEYERDAIKELAGTILEAKQLASDSSIKKIELENQALEENIKLIQRKSEILKRQYDNDLVDLEQSQILMEDGSSDYWGVEVKKYELTLKHQQRIYNEISELRKQGLLETSDEIMSLKEEWEDYETDRLNMIKDARDKQKELEKKYAEDKKSLEKKIQDALIDALKDGIDKKKKELDKELKAYSKAIDDVMKKMDREDSTKSFEEQEQEQSEKILSIQDEINKYKLASASGDAEAKLKVAELEKQLKEEQKKLTELQYKREQELRKDSLNDMKDKAEEETDKAKEELDKQYEDKKAQIESMTNLVDMTHAEWADIIGDFYSDIGISSDGYKNKLEDLQEELKELIKLQEEMANVSNSIPNYGVNDSDKYDPDKNTGSGGDSSSNNNDSNKLTETEAKKQAQLNEAKYLKKLADQAKSTKNDGLYSYVLKERKKWNIASDGSYIGDISGITDEAWNAVKKKYGFYRGGETNGTGWHWLDGEPNKPERVLSSEQTKAFNKLVDYAPNLTKYMENLFNNITGNSGTTVELKVENLVNIEGNVSDNKTISKITDATNEVLTNISNAFKRKGLSF